MKVPAQNGTNAFSVYEVVDKIQYLTVCYSDRQFKKVKCHSVHDFLWNEIYLEEFGYKSCRIVLSDEMSYIVSSFTINVPVTSDAGSLIYCIVQSPSKTKVKEETAKKNISESGKKASTRTEHTIMMVKEELTHAEEERPELSSLVVVLECEFCDDYDVFSEGSDSYRKRDLRHCKFRSPLKRESHVSKKVELSNQTGRYLASREGYRERGKTTSCGENKCIKVDLLEDRMCTQSSEEYGLEHEADENFGVDRVEGKLERIPLRCKEAEVSSWIGLD